MTTIDLLDLDWEPPQQQQNQNKIDSQVNALFEDPFKNQPVLPNVETLPNNLNKNLFDTNQSEKDGEKIKSNRIELNNKIMESIKSI